MCFETLGLKTQNTKIMICTNFGFPHLLFANKLDYKNFSVYYHSNDINTEELKLVLDKSENLLKKSELFKKGTSQDIFICNGYSEFTFFALLSRKAFAVNYPISQNIFISKSSISQNYILRNGKENNKRTLSGVIAHETVHCSKLSGLSSVQFSGVNILLSLQLA